MKNTESLIRPQEPRAPFPYISEDVVYSNEAAGVELAGTLTLPSGLGPFPAAILITGSGAQDRNCEVFGHKLFLVIADHLTRNGIAVLRVDDRGVGASTQSGPQGSATSYDFAGDVEAGLSYLRDRSEISSDKIGLIGHSEGGMIAPIVAVRDPDVAFIVLMAGPGLPGDELLLLQDVNLARADGVDVEEIDRSRQVQREIFDVLKDESLSHSETSEHVRMLMERNPAVLQQSKEARGQMVEELTRKVTSEWFTTFVRHDPRPFLCTVACPVLALNGDRDLQVVCDENIASIRKSLECGESLDWTIRVFPGLNHPFQRCKTGRIDEIALIDETISQEVLDAVADWIAIRFLPETH
ncbi:MAG: alpha/beta fold hydrolase [Phycisphaerales bacterium]|nr:alpha/beta fold hydrolase [Phycisphaerales bacterium]